MLKPLTFTLAAVLTYATLGPFEPYANLCVGIVVLCLLVTIIDTVP